ncbi:cell cycle checkpoint protein RAD17-like [Littorina saxatilis]|uniref:Cell cycle checkpoint protein RAD17 n=1 Tax=Littorina saxatilis TaxID=31220 RepID=A0AAN9B917_9CAEN
MTFSPFPVFRIDLQAKPHEEIGLTMDDSDDDVSIVKVTQAKSQRKGASWVTPSFDDFDFEPSLPSSKSSKGFSQSHSQYSQPKSQPKKTLQTKLSTFASRDDFFNAPSSSASLSRKRQREQQQVPAHKLTSVVKSEAQRRKLKTALSTDLWSDQYQPKKKEDLAVHKKKVEDIWSWLKERTARFTKHAAPILLLTGPPGTGKTATLKILASELRLEIQEWSNPATAAGDSDFKAMEQADWSERSSVDVYSSQSQSSQFSNFLLRANKYQALQLDLTASSTNSSQGKFILVEDIPNSFYRNPEELHNILKKYRRCGHCPLVLVVSDTSTNSSNAQRLFPPDVQVDLRLESINVNPVAPTMMVKVLNKIASQEAAQGRFAAPSARVVESIAMSSAGDVRSAINALQFACRQDTVDLNQLRTIQKRLKKESSGSGRRLKYGSLAKQDSGASNSTQHEVVIGAKDTTCFLFHALGKILYFKRGDPAESGGHQKLPAHLSRHDRDPLLFTPEEIVEKTHLSGEYFNTFLHQNYVDFLSSVEDVERAAEYLSDADLLSAQYTSRGQLQDYTVSVATRGFIHSDSSICRHTDSRKGHGWRPLHKSQWFATQKQSQQSKAAAMRLFRGYHWVPETLLTEIVPYINLTNPTLHDPGQISFVQNVCQFSRSSYALRPGLEKLDEKSAVDDEDDTDEIPTASMNPAFNASQSLARKDNAGDNDDNNDDLPSSQTQIKTAPVEEEEEFFIEEFDD